MPREIGHIRPDMTMSSAEIKAERKAWDDAIAEAVAAEREACARIAVNMTCFDCDSMGHQDPETGEVPCSAESRGEVCVCAEKTTFAHEIAHKIRARNQQS